MPENADEAIEATEAIATGRLGDWGRVRLWPSERVQIGDWTPVQWFDGTLAEAVVGLERNPLLEPAGVRYDIGPAGQRIQDAYEVCDEGTPRALPGFHSVGGTLRRTMLGEPDVWYIPRAKKEGLAARYRERRSHLLVPMRLNTVSGRLTGLWTEQPSFGWWVPVAVEDEDRAKALTVWWNTTPVRLLLLNRRGMTLTYPTWQLAHLREIRIPTPDNGAWNALRDTFDQVCHMELLPMGQAQECAARQIIDTAATEALNLDPAILAEWRERLSSEPTITNRPFVPPTHAAE